MLKDNADIKNNKTEKVSTIKKEIKTLETKVCKVEKSSIIVSINGARMRIYGEGLKATEDMEVEVKYVGDLKDISTIKLIGLVE